MNSRSTTFGGHGRALLLLLVLLTSPSLLSAQGRVSNYIVEQFDGGMTWDWSAPYTYLGWSDNTYYSVSMPFAFNYDGQTVAASSTVRVSTNGWIQFTLPGYSPNGATTTYNQLGSSTYRNMIQFYGVNLYPSGGIYHQTTGSSPNRVWTIYYPSVRYQASSSYPYVSMMLKLYEENGAIEFLYSPNNQYLGSTAVNAGIGLNGHVVPSFEYLTLQNIVDNTPLRNYRVRPPMASRPLLSVSVTGVNFGEMKVGDAPATACITVTNVGTAGEPGADNSPLTFSGTAFNSTNDFKLIANPTQSLYAGESKEYCVSFTPLNIGVLSGGLDIRTNGKDSGNRLISFSGFGLAGRMDVPVENLFRKTRTPVGYDLVREIPVTNDGNYPMNIVEVTAAGEFADQYEIIEIPSDPIEPGETDLIKIEFNSIHEGLNDAQVNITSDAAFEPDHTVQLYGWGIVPRLAVTTSMTGIDSIRIGDTAFYSVRLENVGTDTLHIRKDYLASADPDFFYSGLNGLDSVIAPTQSREVVVGFAPQLRGVRQARLRLTTNIPKTFEATARDTSEFNIDFTHIGVPSGLLYVETIPVDTGLVGDQICNTVTIFNNGLEALTITDASVSGMNATEFTLSGLTLPVTIPANSSINAQLCATPVERGERLADLSVKASSNGQDYTQVIPLAMLAQLECAAPDVTTAFDGSIVRVSTAQSATITVTNCGDVSTVYTASIAGDGYTLLTPAVSSVVAPGETFSYDVNFAPTAMGSVPGELTINGTNIDPMVIALSGVGGRIVLEPSSTNAGSIAVGTSIDFDVNITNTGNMDWTDIAPQLASGDFAVKSAPSSIAAGATGTFTFTFTPSEGGARTASVDFPTFPDGSFSLILNGEGLVASVRPTQISGYSLGQNFPNPFSQSSSITFTMAEAGHARIVLTDVSGATVATIADGYYPSGSNTVNFSLPEHASGSYYYELIAGGKRMQRSMILSR